MIHLPVKGEITPMTQIWHPMWGPWYVDTLLPASSNQVSIQTQHYHHLVYSCCPAPNFESQMKLVFSHWETVWKWYLPGTQAPNFWQQSAVTLCSFMTNSYPCVSPVQTLSVLHRGEDSAQTTIEGHQSPWWSIESVPRENDSERQTVWEGSFSVKETHPRRTEIPKHKRGSPRRSKQICSKKKLCELTLLTRWANSANVSKCQGHMAILSARGMNFLFNCETTSLMLEPDRSGL